MSSPHQTTCDTTAGHEIKKEDALVAAENGFQVLGPVHEQQEMDVARGNKMSFSVTGSEQQQIGIGNTENDKKKANSCADIHKAVRKIILEKEFQRRIANLRNSIRIFGENTPFFPSTTFESIENGDKVYDILKFTNIKTLLLLHFNLYIALL